MCRASRLSVMDGRWDQPVIASRWMGLDGHFADDVVQICDESKRTYSVTTSRITSGEEPNHRSGLAAAVMRMG